MTTLGMQKRQAKKLWHGRAYAISMVALWMSLTVIVGGGVLEYFGELTSNYVDLATGFSLVFVAAVGGVHGTNIAEGFRKPEPEDDEE